MAMTTWPPDFPSSTTPLWLNPNLDAVPSPQEGVPSNVTVDITYTGGTSSLGSTAQFYAFDPNILAPSVPWSTIIGSASWAPLPVAVLPPLPNENTTSASLSWTPTSGETGHTCLFALVTCIADPTPITGTTPWSQAQNDYHLAWHNYTVASVAVADVQAVPKYTYSIPVLAEPRATRTTKIQTRRVPLDENRDLMTGAMPPESKATFGISYGDTGRTKTVGDLQASVVDFGIAIPRDVVRGTAACFEIVALQDGTPVNGYRVLLRFV